MNSIVVRRENLGGQVRDSRLSNWCFARVLSSLEFVQDCLEENNIYLSALSFLIWPDLGGGVLGLLLALPTARGHELSDGDAVLEGRLVDGALYLDQVVLRCEAPSDVELLEVSQQSIIL